MSTAAQTDRPDNSSSITEADLDLLDTQSTLDEPLEATDEVNAVFLRIGSICVVALTIVMVALVTTSVVMRYVFNSSVQIAAEGPTYLFPWLIAAGAVVAQAQMAHIGVDFFLEKFRGKAYQRVNVAIWVFVAVVMAYFTYLGLYMAGPMAEQETPIMGWPQLGSFAALIVMTAALSVQAAARAWFFFRRGAPRALEPASDIPTEAATRGVYSV